MRPNVKKLYENGQKALSEEHDKLEKEKLGVLRAGNSGCIEYDEHGDPVVIGKCHRLTFLRLLGIKPKETPKSKEHNQSLMFEVGYGNEDSWEKNLDAAGVKYAREEECPILWKTDNGTLVSGRPDLIITDKEGKYELGLELKLTCSLWTCYEIALSERPKLSHLIQASHYMWQHNVPFEVWYTNRVNYAVPVSDNDKPHWMSKLFKKHSESPYVETNDSGAVKNILPFLKGYEIKFSKEGVVSYRPTGSKDWVESVVSTEGINNYFNYVSTMQERQTLGPRPLNLKADGSRESYSACAYCPLKSVCDKHEDKFGRWLNEVKKVSTVFNNGSND